MYLLFVINALLTVSLCPLGTTASSLISFRHRKASSSPAVADDKKAPQAAVTGSNAQAIIADLIVGQDAQKMFIDHYKVQDLPKPKSAGHFTPIDEKNLKLCNKDEVGKWKYCYRLVQHDYFVRKGVEFNYDAFWKMSNLKKCHIKEILFYDLSPKISIRLHNKPVGAPMLHCYGKTRSDGSPVILYIMDGTDDEHVFAASEVGLQVKIWYHFRLPSVSDLVLSAAQQQIDRRDEQRQ